MKIKYLFVLAMIIFIAGCATQETIVEEAATPDTTETVASVDEVQVEDVASVEPTVGETMNSEILLFDKTFEPSEASIALGDSVIIKNMGDKIQVIFCSGEFSGIRLAPGETYEYEFSEAGAYDIKTTLGIKVSIIVE